MTEPTCSNSLVYTHWKIEQNYNTSLVKKNCIVCTILKHMQSKTKSINRLADVSFWFPKSYKTSQLIEQQTHLLQFSRWPNKNNHALTNFIILSERNPWFCFLPFSAKKIFQGKQLTVLENVFNPQNYVQSDLSIKVYPRRIA